MVSLVRGTSARLRVENKQGTMRLVGTGRIQVSKAPPMGWLLMRWTTLSLSSLLLQVSSCPLLLMSQNSRISELEEALDIICFNTGFATEMELRGWGAYWVNWWENSDWNPEFAAPSSEVFFLPHTTLKKWFHLPSHSANIGLCPSELDLNLIPHGIPR